MTTEWPPLPEGWQTDKAMQKLRIEKILDAEIEIERDRRAAATQAPGQSPTSTMSFALEQKVHETLFTVATGSIDRARSGAQFVQTAASAIGVLYTGVLAVIFVSDTPVPARGFIPTLFLAVSIGLATAYLAFVNKMDPMDRPILYGSLAEDIWQRTNFLSRYARAIVLQRAPLLRAAVVSLAFGVLLLPIALIQAPVMQGADQPAAIAWPSPPAIEPTELAVVLYQHQLDQFAKANDPQTSTSSNVGDVIALIVAATGLVLTWATATNRLWKDADSDPDGTVVVASTVAPH